LDVKATLDIERYARIDVEATAAESLYSDRALLSPDKNVDFLRRCVETFRQVNFADQASGRVYLRIECGTPIVKDAAAFDSAARAPDTLAGIRAVAPDALKGRVPDAQQAQYLRVQEDANPLPALGQWGQQP
jgi:hypothetical protein